MIEEKAVKETLFKTIESLIKMQFLQLYILAKSFCNIEDVLINFHHFCIFNTLVNHVAFKFALGFLAVELSRLCKE